MNPQKHFKVAGIIVLVLGIVHCCATPLVVPGLKALPGTMWIACAYMFVCTGIAVAFTGWLQFFISRQPEIDAKSRKILKVSVWFMLVLGIGAVATMWSNPFAYFTLLISVYEMICLKFLPGDNLLKSMSFC